MLRKKSYPPSLKISVEDFRIGLIIGAWDALNMSSDQIQQFVKSNYPNTYGILDAKGILDNIFPFSVGEVNYEISQDDQENKPKEFKTSIKEFNKENSLKILGWLSN